MDTSLVIEKRRIRVRYLQEKEWECKVNAAEKAGMTPPIHPKRYFEIVKFYIDQKGLYDDIIGWLVGVKAGLANMAEEAEVEVEATGDYRYENGVGGARDVVAEYRREEVATTNEVKGDYEGYGLREE